ncbi:hypothetical protein [Kitasatospora sp. NPDC057198]|uniref:hypothetical protein n=1 Tax=Kitasatospora sp. NPDC057198 TaxID=3346046 RepID=UPI00363D7119
MGEVGAWEGLFEDGEEPAALPGMRWAWLSGLTRHPALDVRVRLAALVPEMALDGAQPPEVVDAAVASPAWAVRRSWSEHRRDMGLAQWVRLLDGDCPGWQRRVLRRRAHRHGPRPPAERFAGWAADPDPRVRRRALWFRGLPGELAVALAADPDPAVRTEVCEQAWELLGAEQRSALAADPDPAVREVAADLPVGGPLSPAEFAALGEEEGLGAVRARGADGGLARQLAAHPDVWVRRRLAGQPLPLPPEVLAVLAGDPDEDVRAEVAARADTPEQVRAGACAGLPPDRPYWYPEWVGDLHDDPAAMRRLAGSASVAVRRAVARARTLPPDVLALLLRDPRSEVRAEIAVHNAAAPAELLLEAARTWTRPGAVLDRPDFPYHRLRAAWADDPEPTVRRLALYAPDCTPETVERLADDPDPLVHARAAADPRLSPATVLRLLGATEADFRAGVAERGLPVPATYELRRAAVRNPRLPVPVLVGLLRDREQAQDAAGNPAVPAAVAHRMIDLVGGRG